MADQNDQLSQSDAEQIRLKRIAKLQQQPIQNEGINFTKPQVHVSSSSSSSLSKNVEKKPSSSSSSLSKNVEKKPVSRIVTPSNPPSSSFKPQSSSKLSLLSPEEFGQWENGLITTIFKITLDQASSKSQQGLVYLEELKNELEEEEVGSSKLLSVQVADRILISRLSWIPPQTTEELDLGTELRFQTAFDYLTKSWLRSLEERSKALNSKTSPSEKVRSIDKIKELIVSYIGLVTVDPSMFPAPENSKSGTDQLVELFTQPNPSDPLGPHMWTLIHELANRFDNDGLEDVIGPTLVGIAMNINLILSSWHIGRHEWRVQVRSIEALMEIKPIARIVPKLEAWMPIAQTHDRGRRIEFNWLLGPFLALSTFPDRVPHLALEYFSNPKERPRADLESASKGLEAALNSLQLNLYNIFDRIIRSGPSPREAVLDLWAQLIQLNNKRAAIQFEESTLASDGTMINTQAVLLQFAAPFLDSQCSKIDKVDPLYFKRSKRLNIREETKINADMQESTEFFESSPETTPVNFISEIFFLNVAIFRLAILAVAKNWNKKARDIEDMSKELVRAEADNRWNGTPHEAARKASLEKFKKEITKLEAELEAYEVQMRDPEFLSKCNHFCSFVMTWCIRMVDPLRQHPRVPIKLPLPDQCPIEFRMLPEYVLEDVIEFYSFISRHSPGTLLQSTQVIDELMTFTLVFLTTPYLKNYHLKSKFIEILYFNTLTIPNRPNGILGDSLNYHPLALVHLMPALMQIYVEVEITGSHTQFYDKFYSRRYIALILRKVWDNQTHRAALRKQSLTESFIRFANLLMNDVTYLLDDTLGQLQEVHRIESLMDDKEAWDKLTEAERKEEESQLLSCERHCPSFLSLANENVRMLKIFTEETPNAFLKSEIVVRLAAMLDYNLNTLAGPKCQTLKVKDSKKFNFQPKTLLSDLLQVYLNLWDRNEFHEAISNDGRSYTKELFERAGRIARKAALKPQDDLDKLAKMVDKVEQLKQLEADEELELGEIPDEFLDPLMATLMKDPVILPTSKTTVDLSTIKQHFLSDATDPFNRMPLKIEDVVADLELKMKIEAWVKEKKSNKMEM